MPGMMRHTDLTDIDLPTLKEMFRDLESENEHLAIKLTSFWNDLVHFWSDVRQLRGDCQTDYEEMMETEKHHDHEIVMINNVIRWKENKDVNLILKRISLNDLCLLLNFLGYGKNSEVYRKLYRAMGYSLSGYWEIFYWDMNNDEFDEYKPPVKAA